MGFSQSKGSRQRRKFCFGPHAFTHSKKVLGPVKLAVHDEQIFFSTEIPNSRGDAAGWSQECPWVATSNKARRIGGVIITCHQVFGRQAKGITCGQMLTGRMKKEGKERSIQLYSVIGARNLGCGTSACGLFRPGPRARLNRCRRCSVG